MRRRRRSHILALTLSCTLTLGLIVRADAAQADPARPPTVTQVPIRLDTADGPLHGTIDLPVTDGPVPVLIVVAGSGPTDRDGNQPRLRNDSLKLLGRAL